jgi:myo-inositol-1(or 4)-monophosphatase
MSTRSPALEVMIRAARTAAQGLSRDFGNRGELCVDEKGPSDFVTSADLRSEGMLKRELSAAFPEHAFLLEEGGASAGEARARFIVDPLDGTTNFVRGLPHFAVSIALELDGQVVAGVVLDVAKDELFWAEAGAGAWLGDKRLAVAAEEDLSRSVVGTGIPHHGRGDHPRYLAALGGVMREVAGIRRFGSATLDLAYVAAGRFNAFFEQGLAPWDVAAGALLVREAGGVVTKSDGGPMDLGGRDVLAACSAGFHARMIELLAPLHRPSPSGRA